MKVPSILLILLLAISGCELHDTNFDPDYQHVSNDERAEIEIWDEYQEEKLSKEEYELRNPDEFVDSKFKWRQNSNSKWIIEGIIINYATTAKYKDAELTISFYDEHHKLIGTEQHTVFEEFSPGDQAGYYFKSTGFPNAHSLRIEINKLTPLRI